MNITSAQYRQSQSSTNPSDPSVNTVVEVVTDGRKIWVPINPANRHYAEIMRQVDEGTLTIQDAE